MSAEKEGPRDWDKEMAEIDKLMSAPPAAAPGGQAVGRPSAAGGQAVGRSGGQGAAPATSRKATLFTWVRLTLGLTLGVAMTQWPYTHGCGLMLGAYLGGVATVIVASFWSMISSWRTRSGFAHFLSIALLFWGTALAAREVLPRTGYTKETAAWRCGVPLVPAPAVPTPVVNPPTPTP